jgi:hypothetical protein
VRGDWLMLIEEIAKQATQQVQKMSPTEKAKLRQQLDKSKNK